KLVQRLARTAPRRELASIAPFLGELVRAGFADAEGKALRAPRENAVLLGDAVRAARGGWLRGECAGDPVLPVLAGLRRGGAGVAATFGGIDSTRPTVRGLPLRVLVLARPEVSTLFPGLWSEREVQTIKLGPLVRKASEKLVRDALGAGASDAVVARILDRAD